MHAEPFCGLPDGGRIEPGGLDENISRFLSNHGVESTHDSGESNRFARVGDNEVFWRKLAVNSVERFQRLALARAPDDDLAALEQIKIESVRRMADVPKRVIGRVGGSVDGTLIHQREPIGDFLRRCFDGDTVNDLRSVSSAAFFVFDFDFEVEGLRTGGALRHS